MTFAPETVACEVRLIVPELEGTASTTPVTVKVEVDEVGLTSLISMLQFIGAQFGGTVVEA